MPIIVGMSISAQVARKPYSTREHYRPARPTCERKFVGTKRKSSPLLVATSSLTFHSRHCNEGVPLDSCANERSTCTNSNTRNIRALALPCCARTGGGGLRLLCSS